MYGPRDPCRVPVTCVGYMRLVCRLHAPVDASGCRTVEAGQGSGFGGGVCVCGGGGGGGVRDHSPKTDLVNGTQARYFSSGCRRHLAQCVQWMEKPPVAVCPAKQVRPSVETVAVKRMTVKNGHSHCCKNGRCHYCKNGHRYYCKNGHRHYCKNGHRHYCRDGSGRRAALRRSHYDHCSIRPQALFLLHHRPCFCCTTGPVFAAPQALFLLHHRQFLLHYLFFLTICFNPETEKGTE